MKRIRVAHVITRLCKGGAQENTFHTVRLANRERFEVDLISGPTCGKEGSLEPEIRDAGIAIHREPALVRPVSPIRDFQAMFHLRDLFRERGYDIVHTHTSKAGYIGRVAARRAGTPIIVHTPHGNIFHGYFPLGLTRFFVRLERRAAIWTDRIIELTERGIEESLDHGIGRRHQYRSIFSGIDLQPYAAARARRDATRHALGIQPGDVLVGAVGRLEPVKGFTYFIAAARDLAERVPNGRFIVAGQGSLDDALRKQANGLGDRFRFLGLRDDIPDLMAAMDLLVVPSLNEGMGRVILEAAAAATPVVASDVGGIPEVVADDETGVLVPAQSPEALAEAIERLAAEPERLVRMGEAARRNVDPAFGIEKMVMRIEALYEELLKEKQRDT